ncbi:MAG: diaminopimelate epimerase [Hydrogenothermaceae bacterium]|nr:diaminopimelate epimerase [Hydrogenothermaceae bacterium]
MERNFFVKSHGLGNGYIVIDSDYITFQIKPDLVKKMCDVHYGIGSDGLLVKYPSDVADFKLRIFNPDGSEAEKSGNGLRIFCKFLYDYKYTTEDEFTVETKGGIVKAKIEEKEKGKARVITVDMGKATFKPEEVPVNIEKDECLDMDLEVGGRSFKVNCVSVGNPHCVVIVDELNEEDIKRFGPLIENHPLFPNRTNVQFVKLLSKEEVSILIWERGAGFTLASGSSSCGVASVMVKKGLTDRRIKVNMPGGTLTIEVDPNFNIRMTGEVREVCRGVLSDEFF